MLDHSVRNLFKKDHIYCRQIDDLNTAKHSLKYNKIYIKYIIL